MDSYSGANGEQLLLVEVVSSDVVSKVSAISAALITFIVVVVVELEELFLSRKPLDGWPVHTRCATDLYCYKQLNQTMNTSTSFLLA